MKKCLKIAVYVLLGLVVAIVATVAILWHSEIATINSVKQVGDNKYLYEMEYKADYDLDDILAQDIDTNNGLVSYIVKKLTKGLPVNLKTETKAGEFACTSFQAKKAEGEGYYYGRNYDFFKNPSIVTHSHPKNGYASIAASDLSHLGYGLEKLPNDGFKSRLMCVATIYAPVDGINEKGLCTSIMALPKMPSQQNTGKHVAGTSIIMRLWLDRCATVQEALDLLATVDVRHDLKAGSGYHYMVADAQGNCAIVEFDKDDNWKTMIINKEESANYMLITNHLLSPKYYSSVPDQSVGNTHSKSWWRYETADAYLAEKNGILSRDDAQECLSLVHWKDLKWDNGIVEDTQFSNVYDQTELKLYLRSWYDYEDKTYTFEL